MGRRRRQQNLLGQFRCPRCDTWKFPMEFYPNPNTLDRISSRCKDCQKEVQKYYSQSERKKRFEERERIAKLELQVQLLEYEKRLRELQGEPEPAPKDDFVWPDGIDELVANSKNLNTPNSS